MKNKIASKDFRVTPGDKVNLKQWPMRVKPFCESKKLISEFSARLGGTTSVDVAKAGIDKAYGIGKLRDVLGIAIEEMIFIGDALFPGGNDYPGKEAGVVSTQVKDHR